MCTVHRRDLFEEEPTKKESSLDNFLSPNQSNSDLLSQRSYRLHPTRIFCQPVQIKAFVIKRPRSPEEKKKLPPRMNDRLTFGSLLKEAIPLTYEDGDGEASLRPDKSVVFTLRRHPFQSTISFRSPNGRDLRSPPPTPRENWLMRVRWGRGRGNLNMEAKRRRKRSHPINQSVMMKGVESGLSRE